MTEFVDSKEARTNFVTAVREFVEDLSDETVAMLCKSNGSIWVDLDDALSGDVTSASFDALGSISDRAQREAGERGGMIVALDLDGVADGFVVDSGLDDDEAPILPDQQEYSPERGRSTLLQYVDLMLMAGDLDSLFFHLAEEAEAREDA
ncbi:putative uncharacterized protein [Burkholderiales bacterium GJ-E10]|nr:putative uncharacterized protein [Burkholderiales bacterium GJ-E10]